MFSKYVGWAHVKEERKESGPAPDICRVSFGDTKEAAFQLAKTICDVTAGSQLNWTDPRVLPADLGAGSANLSAVVCVSVVAPCVS